MKLYYLSSITQIFLSQMTRHSFGETRMGSVLTSLGRISVGITEFNVGINKSDM